MPNKSPKPISYFGPIFWLHLVLIILAYSSPFLISWWFITAGILVLWILYSVANGDIITQAQFGKDPEMTFYTPYLEKMGLKFNRRSFLIFIRYVMPFIVLAVALIWQVWLGNRPFWF
jgi:hypothetical protein